MRRSTPWLGAVSVAALMVAVASAYCLFGQPPPEPKPAAAPEPFKWGKSPVGPEDSLELLSSKVVGPQKAVCAYFTNHRLDNQPEYENLRSNFGTFILWEDGAATAHVYRNGVAYNQKLLQCDDPKPTDHAFWVFREEPQADGSGEGWALATDATAPDEYEIWRLEWVNKDSLPKTTERFQVATRTTSVKERKPSEK